jgi:hypothetical protein
MVHDINAAIRKGRTPKKVCLKSLTVQFSRFGTVIPEDEGTQPTKKQGPQGKATGKAGSTVQNVA